MVGNPQLLHIRVVSDGLDIDALVGEDIEATLIYIGLPVTKTTYSPRVYYPRAVCKARYEYADGMLAARKEATK